jgi:site-specific recombinase XerC
MKTPKLGKLIIPSLTQAQAYAVLIEKTNSIRDKVIIALFTEPGLRLSELFNIKPEYIT